MSISSSCLLTFYCSKAFQGKWRKLNSLSRVVKERSKTLLDPWREERHFKTIVTEAKLERLRIATPARNMTLDKNDPGLCAGILQQRQAIKGPIVPNALVPPNEGMSSPRTPSPKFQAQPPGFREATIKSPMDSFENALGKRKMSEEVQGKQDPLKKKMRVDD